MLDAQHAVVTVQRQGRDEGFPEVVAVAVTDRAEHPAAILDVAIALDIQDADVAFVGLDDFAVFRVYVEDALVLTEVAGGGDGIDALPEPVARIDVGAEVFARGLAEADDIFGGMDDHARVGFEGDFHTVLGGEIIFFLPERDDDLVPLVVGGFGELAGPGAGYEVGRLVGGASAGAAGEVDQDRVELGGQQYTIAMYRLVGLGDLLVGVDRISVDRNALHFDTVIVEQFLDAGEFLLVLRDTAEFPRVAGITARGQLDRVEPHLLTIRQGVLEFHPAKQR